MRNLAIIIVVFAILILVGCSADNDPPAPQQHPQHTQITQQQDDSDTEAADDAAEQAAIDAMLSVVTQ